MTNLQEKVTSDPDRSAMEKETAFTMVGDEERYTAFSAKPTVVKSLLDHDLFELDWVSVSVDNTRTRVRSRSDAADADAIYAVSGTMPIGTLTVKSAPRSNNYQSSIVNSEQIDPEAFN